MEIDQKAMDKFYTATLAKRCWSVKKEEMEEYKKKKRITTHYITDSHWKMYFGVYDWKGRLINQRSVEALSKGFKKAVKI